MFSGDLTRGWLVHPWRLRDQGADFVAFCSAKERPFSEKKATIATPLGSLTHGHSTRSHEYLMTPPTIVECTRPVAGRSWNGVF